MLGKLLQALEVDGPLAALLEIRFDAKGKLQARTAGSPVATSARAGRSPSSRQPILTAQR